MNKVTSIQALDNAIQCLNSVNSQYSSNPETKKAKAKAAEVWVMIHDRLREQGK